ncbi:glutaredoxin [Rickettsia endosymbiont of Cardiosporidium cionae]|uniref:glutaredoxin n=1 Tax=Rickettsia endosymbiont of Cardiosporidium cionae TaxID=2777155 RepID=UPI0018942C52|nr:glutaredoxin [Rickettsia endosymbiont of Cardiosporidium cionae]KAF8818575.1 hypothetical protein IHI24_000292 [Rickettsia endosymbiont of Cardiosporidium cionae]
MKCFKICVVCFVLVLILIGVYKFLDPNAYVNDSVKENTILENPSMAKDLSVQLYTKIGCKYCTLAQNLLDKHKIHYSNKDISFNQQLQLDLVKLTAQTTVPFVFINHKFIGGYEELVKFMNSYNPKYSAERKDQ